MGDPRKGSREVRWYRVRIKFNLTGDGYWSQLEGIEEIEYFDQLYERYLAQYKWYQTSLCSFIVSNVDWVKEPTLARLIRGTETQPGGARPAKDYYSTTGSQHMVPHPTRPRKSSFVRSGPAFSASRF